MWAIHPGTPNCTMGLLHWKSKFDSTLFPFEFILEDEIDQGGMTRGDISSMFWFNLKKRQHIFYFMLSNRCHYIQNKAPKHKIVGTCGTIKSTKTTKCKTSVHNLQVTTIGLHWKHKKERCRLKNLYLLIVVFVMKSNLMMSHNKHTPTTTNSSLLPTTMFYNHTSLILCCNFNF